MNQGALDRTRFELIEAYLMDRLSGDERTRFERELLEDPGLQAELALQRENTLAIELGGVQRQLRQLAAEHSEMGPARGNGWTHFLKYAAVAALLLSVAIWYVNRPTANELLYAEFHVADPGLPVPMSASENPMFHDAMVDLKMGAFDKALTKWQAQLADDPDNDTLRYYIATAHLEAGDPLSAINLYQGLVDDGTSNFRYKAEWYLLLAHLRSGNEAAVRTFQAAPDSPYATRIHTIKERLGPP